MFAVHRHWVACDRHGLMSESSHCSLRHGRSDAAPNGPNVCHPSHQRRAIVFVLYRYLGTPISVDWHDAIGDRRHGAQRCAAQPQTCATQVVTQATSAQPCTQKLAHDTSSLQGCWASSSGPSPRFCLLNVCYECHAAKSPARRLLQQAATAAVCGRGPNGS